MKAREPIVEIIGTGRYVPDHVMTNADMEKLVDTSDEWIFERTGIRERRIADADMGAAEMAARASRIAMERAGIQPGEVDVIVLSTATPDRLLPSTACDMQALLGATNAAAYDISAACSGFLYAMSIAEGHIASGNAEIALVVSTEKMSAIVDWTDRTTCVLFGDGAGAAVLRRAQPGSKGHGIVSSFMRSDGTLAELLWRPSGGAMVPMDLAVLDNKSHLVRMAGREVFKSAVRSMAEAADQALMKAGLTGADIDLLVPHQANMRIIEATARYAGIPMEKVFVNVDRYGNMSSATIPVALDEAVRSMAEAADQALMRAGLTGADIDLLVPHQANMRIIEATARYAGIPMEKVFVNVDRYGNMSSATIPVALDEAVEQGRLKSGDNLMMVAFGAGFTWASTVMKW